MGISKGEEMKEYICVESPNEVNGGMLVREQELIRCKDCVYFTPEKSGEHWNVCRFYDAPKTADGYCNDAEPKDNEE